MGGKNKPKPCFLDDKKYYGIREGKKVWRSSDDKRYYTWDSLHGEIEVFDKRGSHLGSANAVSGKLIKYPVKGRKIKV